MSDPYYARIDAREALRRAVINARANSHPAATSWAQVAIALHLTGTHAEISNSDVCTIEDGV